MADLPRITIVTPSFNQGRFIAETIDSVVAQDYPDLEHLVMDGGSTDDTLDILRRYPHLTVVSERDRGQGDAINKGFERATGAVWGFLNSDDTLLPGALHTVAHAIDPAAGRHVVMGRCRFIDDRGRYTGIEHPSRFESFARVLAIWKGYMIPQPAVFWTPEVWRTCGGFDISLKYHLDYDLFCRFARRYRFHQIDQVLATYRLHPESKTEAWTEADRLADSIRLSRRYWGSPLGLLYWRLAASLWWYRFDRVGRARRLYGASREAARRGARVRAAVSLAGAAALAPGVAFNLGVYPRLRAGVQGPVGRLARRLVGPPRIYPQTAAYLDRTEPWDDGWLGPRMVVTRTAGEGCRRVVVRGRTDLTYLDGPLELSVTAGGQTAAAAPIETSGPFEVVVDLPGTLPPGPHEIEVRASRWLVPHRINGGGDFRPLSWRITSRDAVALASAGAATVPVEHGKDRPPAGVLWYAAGWRMPEGSLLDWLRWTSERGTLEIEIDRPVAGLLRGEAFSIRRPNCAIVTVNGAPAGAVALDGPAYVPFDMVVHLIEGPNRIEIASAEPPALVPGDPRPLAVAVRNLSLER